MPEHAKKNSKQTAFESPNGSASSPPGEQSGKKHGAGKPFGQKTFPLHLHISFVYIVLIVILLTIIGVFNYWEAKKNVLLSSRQIFMQINSEIKEKLRHLQDTASETIAYLYQSPLIGSKDFESQIKFAPLAGTMMKIHSELDSIDIGYANGDFFKIGRVKGPDPQKAQYVIRNYENSEQKQTLTYLDHHFEAVRQRENPHDGYDPRSREWYAQAIQTDKLVSTRPYFFHESKKIGKSFAQRNKNGDMVIGIAFMLVGIDKIFDSAKSSDASSLLVFDNEDNVLYYSELDIAAKELPNGDQALFKLSELDYPLRENIKDKIDSESFNIPFSAKLDGEELIYAVSKLTDDSVGGMSYYVAISSPASAILPSAAGLIRHQGMFTLLALVIAIPASWLFSRRLSRDLVSLSGVARDAGNFSFSLDEPVYSSVKEFNELSDSIFRTNRTLKRFLDINTALSLEKNYDKLLDTVLQETMGTVGASVGIIYLLSADEKQLLPSAANCVYAECGGKPGASGLLGSLQPIERANAGQAKYLAAAIRGVPQISSAPREDWPSERMRELLGSRKMHLITTPLVYNRKVTGVLCLYRDNENKEPNGDMLSFIGRLSGGAAVAIENHRLIYEQKKLFNAFIRLLAGSIDSKSHYTGGHCQRVPVIAKILALAVDKADEGPFAKFHINGNGWEVLRISSWLHDCGKIITPEHVVDKATKLETVYNRIHEIRMRFEVLKRDAEISFCRSMLQGGDPHMAHERFLAECRQLDDDFAFLAKCNIGEEGVTPEHIRRLKKIAARTWKRTISDRLGLSEAEKKRKEAAPEGPLPAIEPLLADKQEHLIKTEPLGNITGNSGAREFSSTFPAPEYRYNFGEITNLSIPWGTLTGEERYQVNNHVVQTIFMLSHLPFPQEYGDIVEIAGSHHERMDAGGYPRGIGKENMKVEARIIAIADVFEALTAADRPYKKAKTLSEALAIMSKMAKSGHLDPDLFAVFIQSGAYRKYADLFLEAFQLDEVDEGSLL